MNFWHTNGDLGRAHNKLTQKKKQQKNGKHLSLAPRLVEAEEEAATQQKSIDSLVIWLGTLELSGLAAPTAASFSSPSKVTN